MVQDISKGHYIATQSIYYVEPEFLQLLIEEGLVDSIMVHVKKMKTEHSFVQYCSKTLKGKGSTLVNPNSNTGYQHCRTTWLDLLFHIGQPLLYDEECREQTLVKYYANSDNLKPIMDIMMPTKNNAGGDDGNADDYFRCGTIFGDSEFYIIGTMYWLEILCFIVDLEQARDKLDFSMKKDILKFAANILCLVSDPDDEIVILKKESSETSSPPSSLELLSSKEFLAAIQRGANDGNCIGGGKAKDVSTILGEVQSHAAFVVQCLTIQTGQQECEDLLMYLINLPILLSSSSSSSPSGANNNHDRHVTTTTVTFSYRLVDIISACRDKSYVQGGMRCLLNVYCRVISTLGPPPPPPPPDVDAAVSKSSSLRTTTMENMKLVKLLKSKKLRTSNDSNLASLTIGAVFNSTHPQASYDENEDGNNSIRFMKANDLCCAATVKAGVLEAILSLLSSHAHDRDFVTSSERFVELLSNMALNAKTGSALRRVKTKVLPLLTDSDYGSSSQLQNKIEDVLEKASIGKSNKDKEDDIDKHCEHCCKMWTNPDKNMPYCAKCKKVYYCSKECQVADWKNGHKVLCKRILAEGKKALRTLDSAMDTFYSQNIRPIFLLASFRGYDITDSVVIIDLRPARPTFDVALIDDFLEKYTDCSEERDEFSKLLQKLDPHKGFLSVAGLHQDKTMIKGYIAGDDEDEIIRKSFATDALEALGLPRWSLVQKAYETMFEDAIPESIESIRSNPDEKEKWIQIMKNKSWENEEF